MQMFINHIVLCYLFALVSCKTEKSTETKATDTNNNFDEVAEKNVQEEKNDFSDYRILDVFEIKQRCKPYSTSTFLSKSKTSIYSSHSENGYFGNYTLFTQQKENDKVEAVYMGEMVIFNTETPWKYDNKTDEFIEILIVNEGILLFENFGVGMPKHLFVEKLGTPLKSTQNVMVFKVGKYYMSIWLENDRANKLKAGHYSNNTSELEIITYLKDFDKKD
jgi:hypothetical protein